MRLGSKEKTVKKRQKSTKTQIIFLIVWIIIFALLAFEVYKLANYTLGKSDRENLWLYNSVDKVVQKIYPKTSSLETEENKVSIATLGNIYLTPNMTKGALGKDGYDFSEGLEDVQEKLKTFDFVTANLYTPVAGKKLGYSTTKNYNAPDELITTIQDLNISAVSTATYHAYDKEEEGITATIEKLQNVNIKQTGISDNERSKPIVLSKNNINIGVLSYTTKSNVKLDEDSECLNILSKENVIEDVKYLKEQKSDVIFAYLDIYDNDTILTSSEHKKNVDMLFDNGVNIVLGGGVAAVQDNYEDEIELSDKSKSHVYTIYSLGDFIGGYTSEYGNSVIIPSFEITKNITKNKKGEVKQEIVNFKVSSPILAWTTVNKNYSKNMLLMEDEISNFNNDKSVLSAKEYKLMKEEYTRIINMYD